MSARTTELKNAVVEAAIEWFRNGSCRDLISSCRALLEHEERGALATGITVERFHRDCHRAACECPQGHTDRTIYPEGVGTDPGATFNYWVSNRLLWEKGYCVHLADSTRKIFRQVEAAKLEAVSKVLE